MENATDAFYFEMSFTTLVATAVNGGSSDAVSITSLRWGTDDKPRVDTDTGLDFGTYDYDIDWSISTDGVTFASLGTTNASMTDGQGYLREAEAISYALDFSQTYTVRMELSPDAGDDHIHFDDPGLVLTYTDTIPEPSSVALLCLGGLALTARRKR